MTLQNPTELPPVRTETARIGQRLVTITVTPHHDPRIIAPVWTARNDLITRAGKPDAWLSPTAATLNEISRLLRETGNLLNIPANK